MLCAFPYLVIRVRFVSARASYFSTKMDTDTLEKVLKTMARQYKKSTHSKLITGVYSCDYLSRSKVRCRKNKTNARAIIVNLDESDKPGSHWQALWIPTKNDPEHTQRTCVFFDSYGRPPTNKHIQKYIKDVSQITKWKKKQLQSFESVYCGEWCCIFLWSMLNGYSINDFYESFSSQNFEKNDQNVLRMFCSLFSAVKSNKKVRQICCKFSECNSK